MRSRIKDLLLTASGNILKAARSLLRIDCASVGCERSNLTENKKTLTRQYFNRAYPGSLFSISGSTSDEVHAGSASDESSEKLVKGPDDNTAVDQLWPKLEDLLSPFGLRRRKALDQDQVESVRAEADDLKGKT